MALTVLCEDNRPCEFEQEEFHQMHGGGYEPRGGCFNPAEPHSTLCEEHGGEAETESFLEEWEHHIADADDICQHINDGEEPDKIAAFTRGELPA